MPSSAPGAPRRIAIAGASGRMGRMLIESVLAAPDLQLAAALDIAGSAALGADAGAFAGNNTGVHVSADLQQLTAPPALMQPVKPQLLTLPKPFPSYLRPTCRWA
jgi:4-hydroxy-tetrahydrodipicolinate reductase